jgi:hypothetical protein
MHGMSDMMISIEDSWRDRRYDVGAVNEAEGGIAEPLRIVVEELLAAVARAAERIGDDRPAVRCARRGQDRQRTAEAVSGKEDGPSGVGRIDNGGLDARPD